MSHPTKNTAPGGFPSMSPLDDELPHITTPTLTPDGKKVEMTHAHTDMGHRFHRLRAPNGRFAKGDPVTPTPIAYPQFRGQNELPDVSKVKLSRAKEEAAFAKFNEEQLSDQAASIDLASPSKQLRQSIEDIQTLDAIAKGTPTKPAEATKPVQTAATEASTKRPEVVQQTRFEIPAQASTTQEQTSTAQGKPETSQYDADAYYQYYYPYQQQPIYAYHAQIPMNPQSSPDESTGYSGPASQPGSRYESTFHAAPRPAGTAIGYDGSRRIRLHQLSNLP